MAYPFEAAEVLTAVDLNAMIGAPTQNAQTGTTYTAVLLDAGKTVTLSNASAVTLTIPAQASVSWADNTQLNFLNIGAGTVTVTPAAGVTINGTPLTLETSKGGSLVRTASNVWTFIPFSAGVEAANFTNAATGTYTTGGKDYKYITFTGSGSLVVDQAGFADILVVAGGGGSGTFGSYSTGGGAGGVLELTNAYLPEGTLTVTIGAGGTSLSNGSANSGNDSVLGTFVAVGGGGGGGTNDATTLSHGCTGGSGAGGSGLSRSAGPAVTNQGNIGGSVASGYAAGGGAGSAASGSTPGNPKSSSITGTAVNYSKGGSNSAGTTPNTANSGNGGGGAANGNSGTVIIRVVV